MRLLLCALLFFSVGWVGIQYSAECKRKPAILLSLANSLSILQTEICNRRTPLPEALMHCAMSFHNLNSFYQFLLIGTKTEQSFFHVWTRAVMQLYPYRGEAQHALLALGNQIGRYDAQTQETAFLLCISSLRNSASEMKNESKTSARLAIGLSTVCGLLLAIVCY